MAEAITEDIEEMREVLKSDDWHTLHEKLLEYVDNYTQKVVHITNGGFQL